MANAGFSLRTGIEYAAFLGVILVFFGGSTFKSFFETNQGNYDSTTVSQDRIDALVYPDKYLECPEHTLDIHIFSRSPLVIYIPNFLLDEEAAHLVELSDLLWTPSTIHNADSELLDDTIRKSEKALIPRDTTVRCLERRAISFQGWPTHTFIERLMTQRYLPGGHYSHHYDWAHANPNARRVSTFMVYVSNSTGQDSDGAERLEGGGTEFPLLKRPEGQEWCAFIECNGTSPGTSVTGSDTKEGVTFLPKAGAAVYWENFDAEGRGWKEGLHAGLPVTKGIKIGLNIWSWYQRGHVGPGDDEAGE